MIQLLGRRRLERCHLATLRVDAGHDVLDGTVLAGGVHGLKDEQHRPGVLRIENVLQLGQGFDAHLQDFLGARLVLRFEWTGVRGINILQPECLAVGDAVGLAEPAGFFDELLELHGRHYTRMACAFLSAADSHSRLAAP